MTPDTKTTQRIEAAFHAGIRAREHLEEGYHDPTCPTGDLEQTYAEKRGNFRLEVINAMRGEMVKAMDEYIVAAQDLSEAWEAMANIDHFFTRQNLPSTLPHRFLASVKVPSPMQNYGDLIDGTQADKFRCDVSDLLSEEGMQLSTMTSPRNVIRPPRLLTTPASCTPTCRWANNLNTASLAAKEVW